MIIKQKTIYQVSYFCHENGIGPTAFFCEEKETIIDYLTHCGRSHAVLSDEFGEITDKAVLLDSIDDRTVLKISHPQEEGGLFALCGAHPEPDEYYIIHTVSLIQDLQVESVS